MVGQKWCATSAANTKKAKNAAAEFSRLTNFIPATMLSRSYRTLQNAASKKKTAAKPAATKRAFSIIFFRPHPLRRTTPEATRSRNG